MPSSEFVGRFRDEISGPAKGAAGGMRALGDSMRKASAGVKAADAALRKLRTPMANLKADIAKSKAANATRLRQIEQSQRAITRVHEREAAKRERIQLRQNMVAAREAVRRRRIADRAAMQQQRAYTRMQAQQAKTGFFGQALAANLAAEAIRRVGRAVMDAAVGFGKAVISGGAFLESSQMAFKMLLKDSAAGADALDFTRKAAVRYGLDVRETAASMKKLLAAQFTLGEAKSIVKLGADMQALGASGQEVQSVIRAITQIKGKGRLQMEELNQQLAETGLSTKLVIDNLAKSMGKTTTEIRKMISAGEVSSDQGIAAIKAALKQKLGIEKLGDAADKTAGTLSGMWNRFKAMGQEAILKIGEKAFPALSKAAKRVFEKVTKWMASPEFDATIERIGQGIANFINNDLPKLEAFGESFVDTFDRMSEGSDKFTKMLDKLGVGEMDADAFSKMGEGLAIMNAGLLMIEPTLRLVAYSIETTAGVIRASFGPIPAMVNAISGQIDTSSFSAAAQGIGRAIVSGLVSGITGGPIIDKLVSVAKAAIKAAENALGVGSPSKEFMRIGHSVGQGMQLGIEDYQPAVSAAAMGLVVPEMPYMPAANTTTNRTDVSAPMTFNVSGGDNPQATAEAIKQILASELGDMFEQISIQVGAA